MNLWKTFLLAKKTAPSLDHNVMTLLAAPSSDVGQFMVRSFNTIKNP